MWEGGWMRRIRSVQRRPGSGRSLFSMPNCIPLGLHCTEIPWILSLGHRQPYFRLLYFCNSYK